MADDLVALAQNKAFCSWLCPVGTLSEYLWQVGRRMLGRNVDRTQKRGDRSGEQAIQDVGEPELFRHKNCCAPQAVIFLPCPTIRGT